MADPPDPPPYDKTMGTPYLDTLDPEFRAKVQARADEIKAIIEGLDVLTIEEFRALPDDVIDALFSLEGATVVARRYQITPHDGEPRASWKRRVVEASYTSQTLAELHGVVS